MNVTSTDQCRFYKVDKMLKSGFLRLFLVTSVFACVHAESRAADNSFPAYFMYAYMDQELLFDMSLVESQSDSYKLYTDNAYIQTTITLSSDRKADQVPSPYNSFDGSSMNLGRMKANDIELKVSIEAPSHYVDSLSAYSGKMKVEYFGRYDSLGQITNALEQRSKKILANNKSLAPMIQKTIRYNQYIASKYLESKSYKKEVEDLGGTNLYSFNAKDNGGKFKEIAEFKINDFYNAKTKNLSKINKFQPAIFTGNIPGAVSQVSQASNQVGLAYFIYSSTAAFPTRVDITDRDMRTITPEHSFSCDRGSSRKFTCTIKKSDVFMLRMPSSDELPKFSMPYFMYQGALESGISEQEFNQFITKNRD